MGVKASASSTEIDNFFLKMMSIVREELIRTFSYLGEECVSRIRTRDQSESWIDRTGNLRSSIGYSVVEQGKQRIQSAFSIVREGTEGANEGKRLLEELSKKYADTYALVVVAGMNYADEVEARDNKDVLASTELYAREKMDKYLAETKKRVEKRINALKL